MFLKTQQGSKEETEYSSREVREYQDPEDHCPRMSVGDSTRWRKQESSRPPWEIIKMWDTKHD